LDLRGPGRRAGAGAGLGVGASSVVYADVDEVGAVTAGAG
jgi:hypothetical protein